MTEDYKQMKKEIEEFVKEHKKALEEAIKESFTLECKKINELEKERDELKKTVENQKLEYEEVQCDINTLVADNSVLYKQISELKQANKELVEDNLNLSKENKELKEEIQAIKSYLGIESKTILERLEELDEWKHNDKLLLWKYRSALEEIKGTVQKGMYSLKKGYSREYQDTLSNIFNKINEVLE